MMAGVDVLVSERVAVGAALGRSHLDASRNGLAGRIEGKLNTVAVYGRATLGNQGYLSGRLSDGRLHASMRTYRTTGRDLTEFGRQSE